MDGRITGLLGRTRLFHGMTPEQIESLLLGGHARCRTYETGEVIFHDGDTPAEMFLLLSGKVLVTKSAFTGNRMILTQIDEPGDLFGEVYLFMKKARYEVEAEAAERSEVLSLSVPELHKKEMPETLRFSGEEYSAVRGEEAMTPHFSGEESLVARMGVSMRAGEAEQLHQEAVQRFQQNLLTIFATKAYLLNNRVRLLGSPTLRGKIAHYLLQRQNADGVVARVPTREMMAELLSVARPSLSRELSHMEKEGLIELKDKGIVIRDAAALEKYL
ncbi:MAG: Crp/Fnr family transcriptional regulator [Eubacteriales bacterium]|nr:Crp/Fnr family transcriptional regulator [Eubacteriales bacterium]